METPVQKWQLGQLPLPRAVGDSPTKKAYPLSFKVRSEGYLSLTERVKPEKMFVDYSYRSSTMEKKHIINRVDQANKAFNTINKTFVTSVAEIACNDGYLLNEYATSHMEEVKTIVGIEPAKNLHRYNKAKVYGSFFNHQFGIFLGKQYGGFDIVHAHNVLPHTPKPVNMLRGIRAMLQPKGIALVGFQYLVDLLMNTQFYHFHHEHYSYLSVSAVRSMAWQAGLALLDFQHTDEHGGSMVCVLGRDDTFNAVEGDDKFRDTLSLEEIYLSDSATYDSFVERMHKQLDLFVEWTLRQPPKSLAIIFASAKATVILNLAANRGLKLDRFVHVYDDAPENWGHFVPGTLIPIREMETGERGKAVLFAPNLLDIAQSRLPQAEIVNIKDILIHG